MPPDRSGDPVRCPGCGRPVDLASQQAFLRAEDAFLSVAEEASRFAWRGDGRSVFRAKAPPDSLPLPRAVVLAYQHAYGGLRIALEGQLSEDQQLAGAKMMAEITRAFAPRAMVSPLEAEYWAKRTVAAFAEQELSEIEASLAEEPGSIFRRLTRVHLILRRHQLRRALSRLQTQLKEIERATGF